MYVGRYACMYVCMHVCMYVCRYVGMIAFMYVDRLSIVIILTSKI